MEYSIAEIAKITGGDLIAAEANRKVTEITTDSRSISWPDKSMFVALRTRRNNGHRYVGACIQMGVRAFLVDDESRIWEKYKEENVAYVVVKDTLSALQQLAAYHRSRFDIPVIGITGSNGKTVVKEWLNEMIGEDKVVTRSPRSYNSQIGVALSLLGIDSKTEIAIIEAGMSEKGEMKRLEWMIRPTMGVFTHLGEAHQENFSSMKEKCEEKMELMKHASLVIYSSDNKLVDITARQLLEEHVLNGWHEAEVDKEARTKIESLFRDSASRENAYTCLHVMRALGYKIPDIIDRMDALTPIEMRLEVKSGVRGCLVINDAYNSDLTSIGIALDFLVEEAKEKGLEKVAILSDIEQSGKRDDALYDELSDMLNNKGIEQVIGVGSHISHSLKPIGKMRLDAFETTDDLMRSGLLEKMERKAVLLKGARKFRFERIDECLSENVHQTTLEVDLGALLRNVDYYKSFLKEGTKMVHMVKANAYGSGDAEVALALQKHGCDYLAVAVADEGARLREEGIHVPIIVMNPEIHSLSKLVEHHLEPEVYNFRILSSVIEETKRQGVKDYPIHVKVNTGMNRLGFDYPEIEEVAKMLREQDSVEVKSVFSHFVGSDESRFDDFTTIQYERFNKAADALQKCQERRILRHICNSAGIERFPQYQMDMVRLGIGHYGFSATGGGLEEVCTLKTTILQVREVPETETVSYCRNGKLQRKSKIAAIPIGYADGLDRRLGNRGYQVLVNGKKADIVGNVCMDVCMLDVTGMDVKEGDEVIVFGKELSLNRMAQKLGTISYEILTGISPRVKRLYYKS